MYVGRYLNDYSWYMQVCQLVHIDYVAMWKILKWIKIGEFGE